MSILPFSYSREKFSFTGSISDKAITEQSGFYDLITQLKQHGYVKEGDAVMVDKGFTIGVN
jgi:hypothetical protein